MQFGQQTGIARTIGGGKFQDAHGFHRVGRQVAAFDALDEFGTVRAEGVFRGEAVFAAFAFAQSNEQLFQRRQQFAAPQLQRGGRGGEGVNQRLAVFQTDAIVQGDQTVWLNAGGVGIHVVAGGVGGAAKNWLQNIRMTPSVMAESARLKAGKP